jgi:hypothetical protein
MKIMPLAMPASAKTAASCPAPRLDAQAGTADLEQTLIGFPSPTSQPIKFTSERYGMFVQGSYKFSPM